MKPTRKCGLCPPTFLQAVFISVGLPELLKAAKLYRWLEGNSPRSILELLNTSAQGSFRMLRQLLLVFLILLPCSGPGLAHDPAALIHPLIDPAKLETLGKRGANPRVQKITAILWQAKQNGHDPSMVAQKAVGRIGWGGTEKGNLTAAAMVRNLTILERLGGTTPEDLADMRRGRTADVRRGPYAGEVISVDHIIPRSVAPELENVIANLELMPLTLNLRKGDKVSDRQTALAKQLHKAGLLSDEAFRRVMAAKR